MRPKGDRHAPQSAILSIEQTSNMGGGTIWPLQQVREVAATAREHGLAIHMDGARLLNAVVASEIAARDYAAPCDSVWIDLSKGLGCPVGAVLAGDAAFIEDAVRSKHLFGGAMRQAGIIAAAGVYALEHHVERLAEDHDKARRLAQGLAQIHGISIDPETVETNLVFFEVEESTGLTASELSRRLGEGHGVRIGAIDRRRLRAVTHLDVPADGIDKALAAVRAVLAG